MTDYKLVPVEPTTAMRAVWKCMRGYCWYDKYKAMLAAAPAVQEEPGALSGLADSWDLSADELYEEGRNDRADAFQECAAEVRQYAAPQPTEQHPDDRAAASLDKQCREDVAAALGFIRGGNYAWSYLLQQIKDITTAAEQQDELSDYGRGFRDGKLDRLIDEVLAESALVEALERIAAFQPKDILCGSGWQEWNRAGEYAASIARDALAAHHSQGGGQ